VVCDEIFGTKKKFSPLSGGWKELVKMRTNKMNENHPKGKNHPKMRMI
jgi:hypothetical protein